MEGQLRKLRNNTHPKTGAELPAAIELEVPQVMARENKDEGEHVVPDGVYEYVPAITPAAVASISSDGRSSSERREALHGRIKAKESANLMATSVQQSSVIDQAGDSNAKDALGPTVAATEREDEMIAKEALGPT